MRQIALDTETTGLSAAQGHRVIEIGCVELVNRRLTGRDFHTYLNPEREIEEDAERVHGIRLSDLVNAPRFADIADDFLGFIAGAELIIHNAAFDVGFLENELSLVGHGQPSLAVHATVLDTLTLAREIHPGQRNSLDALCKRYQVDASNRTLHGALVDAELLARVYLAMTGGQAALTLDSAAPAAGEGPGLGAGSGAAARFKLNVVRASESETAAHEAFLEVIRSGGRCVWDAAGES